MVRSCLSCPSMLNYPNIPTRTDFNPHSKILAHRQSYW